MGRVIPGASIPDTLNTPAGAHVFSIDQLEETLSNAQGRTDKIQKLMYVAHLTTVEPVPGMFHRDYFNIGSDDDPGAELPETWIANARRLKLFCAKAGVPISGDADMDEVAAALAGQLVGGVIVIQKDIDQGSRYYGQEQSKVVNWFQPGEREPKLDPGSAPTVTAGKRPAATRPAAAAPAAPTAPRPAPARTAPAPAPAAAPPRATPGKPAPRAAAPAASDPQVACSICQQAVPRSEFRAHVAAHAEDE